MKTTYDWRHLLRNKKNHYHRRHLKYCAHLHHTLAALKKDFPASLVTPLPSSEQTNLPFSNHTYTKSTPKHIHHHYAPSVTSTHTTHIISSTAPTYAPHCHPWICGQTPPEWLHCWPDGGEADWWTTSGNIGLPPLARVMGVGRQQHWPINIFTTYTLSLPTTRHSLSPKFFVLKNNKVCPFFDEFSCIAAHQFIINVMYTLFTARGKM